jgi:hypothetical protein
LIEACSATSLNLAGHATIRVSGVRWSGLGCGNDQADFPGSIAAPSAPQ